MHLACPDCGGSLEWSLDRVGNQPILMSKCRHCDPGGPWHHEPVEIVRKPRGKAGLWPVPTDVPFAPVDDLNSPIYHPRPQRRGGPWQAFTTTAERFRSRNRLNSPEPSARGTRGPCMSARKRSGLGCRNSGCAGRARGIRIIGTFCHHVEAQPPNGFQKILMAHRIALQKIHSRFTRVLHNPLGSNRYSNREASWRSGDAADCKFPATSTIPIHFLNVPALSKGWDRLFVGDFRKS